MEYKRITNSLVEIEYKEDKNAEILDCTKEIEETIKELIPK